MSVENTIEVRWWARGTLPEDALAWFCTDRRCKEERRIDHYLLRQAHAGAGVKRRGEEGLDVKVRLDRRDDVTLGGGTGHVEWWRKWSFLLAEEQPSPDLARTDDWVAVAKRRWRRELDGWEVELAEARVDGVSWWSYGLESDAAAHDLVQLVRLLDAEDAFPPGLDATADTSRGYAEHLEHELGRGVSPPGAVVGPEHGAFGASDRLPPR